MVGDAAVDRRDRGEPARADQVAPAAGCGAPPRSRPPSWPYSLARVLKQCGQVATIFLHAAPGSASPRSAGPASGTRTRCRSAGPGHRCRSRRCRGSRSRRRPRAAGWRPPGWSSSPGPRTRRRSRPRTGTRSRRRRAGPGYLEVQALGPVLPGVRRRAPRVALVLQVAQHHAGLGREVRLDQHLVAAHVDDVVDVLDVHRALLDAGAAGGARPQHVRVDHAAGARVADQRALRLGQREHVDLGQLRRRRLLRPGQVPAAAGQQVRRLGVGVVAQATAPAASGTAACRCSRPGTATGTGRTRCRW